MNRNLRLTMVDFNQIRTLLLVSEQGSLAAAARELNISPAAVSKQLSRLEEELGLQLLIRSTRHLELTEIGTNYCEQCRRILEEVEAAESLISNMKTAPHGVLNIVSGRYFASAYIVPHLKEFLAKYPEIQLNLELSERIPDMNVESIDVLIGMSVSAAGECIQRRILTTRYVYCASKSYIKHFGEPKKPLDLTKHRYITHSMRKPDDKLIFSNKETVSITPFLRVNDAETMVRLAQEGLGIIKLHHYMVDDLLEQGQLKELLKNYVEPEIPIYVAYPQRRYLPAKVRCFIDFVVSKIK